MITASKLIMKLQALQKDLSDGALESPAADFSRYQLLVGRYKGLQEAINIIKEFEDDE